MAMIDIKRVVVDGVEKVVFDPSPLVWPVGSDGIFWRNLDPKESHRLTVKGQPDSFWFAFSLAPFVAGQEPATTNPAITFQSQPVPPTVTYVCTLHAGEEGQITVV